MSSIEQATEAPPRPGMPERAGRWMAALRTLALASAAGLGAGFLAGGIGSRGAMRVIAMATETSGRAVRTENGNVVGEITLGGTTALLVLGAMVGVAGAALFLILRPWVPWRGAARGLVYGSILFALFGSFLVSPNNQDFFRFGSPVLNVVLFSALFPAYGVILVPTLEWLERSLPGPPASRPVLAGYGTLTAVGLMVWVPLIIGAATGVPLMLLGIALAGASSYALHRWRRRRPNPAPGRPLLMAGYVALGAACAAGLVRFADQAAEIMG